MYVLGTAGHVDHGKSTLVQALTGIDPDRLREEKERGMTIDLGFAWLKLPSGREVSIVDVPGHERFIKNMLAGVGGIDLALLIVAADEGVMPQTREHLAILDLLRVTSGIAVITKADLVDAELLELVTDDVREVLAETSLAGAPILPVSAVTREGLPELLAAIDRLLDFVPARDDLARPRLPIDRVFTISGFGTVVTGTLIGGTLSVGQEVEILPAGIKTRNRGLQTHRTKVDRAEPGSRVAANLQGVATTDLQRGDVLTTPGWLRPTTAFDARLRAIADLDRLLRHNMPVTLHLYSSEVPARVRLLDAQELLPGDSAWAQLRTDSPVAALKGDLFVIRSSNETLGGGEVVDTAARRHRRFDPPTLDRLATLERGSPEDVLLQSLRAAEPTEVAALLKAAPMPAAGARAALTNLLADGRALVLANRPAEGNAIVLSVGGWHALSSKVTGTLAGYHQQHPLRAGMPREELKSRVNLSARVFTDVLAELRAGGDITESAATVAQAGFQPTLNSRQQAEADAYLASLRANPYAPPTDAPVDAELLNYLIEDGQVVRVHEGVVFDAVAYNEMVDRVTERIRADSKVTVAEVRDMFGTSRRYALGLLGYLDELRITRRVGDDRVLR